MYLDLLRAEYAIEIHGDNNNNNNNNFLETRLQDTIGK